MFTGLIEQTGRLKDVAAGAESTVITIEHEKWSEPLSDGESVAVQGACLTVTSHDDTSFKADALDETLSKTNLKSVSVGSLLNLERALKSGDRLGGHFVSGHVDCTARILGITQDGNDRVLTVECSDETAVTVVQKGSVTIDGISLTVADVSEGSFSVRIIPYTWGHTSLTEVEARGTVNLETDILGKYVQRLLKDGKNIDEVSMETLKNAGYL